MGSCYYRARETHVSLGIMNVHPNHFGKGVARRCSITSWVPGATGGPAAARLQCNATRLVLALHEGRVRAASALSGSRGRRARDGLGVQVEGSDTSATRPRRRRRLGRARACRQRHQPSQGLPLLHRERAGVLAHLGVRGPKGAWKAPRLDRPSALPRVRPGVAGARRPVPPCSSPSSTATADGRPTSWCPSSARSSCGSPIALAVAIRSSTWRRFVVTHSRSEA
jgi:hypothetical protein